MSRKKKQQQQKLRRVEAKAKHEAGKTDNPFDLRFSKLRHATMSSKGASMVRAGAPSTARQREVTVRREALLKQYSQLARAGGFRDRRLGEKDRGLDRAEKAALRFAAERKRRAKKAAMFRLEDDAVSSHEQLTHKGQSIAEIERFDDDPNAGSGSDLDDQMGLQEEYVKSMHFGGLDLEHGGSANETPLGSGILDRKSLVGQMIDESKEKKRTQLAEKEDVKNLTAKADADWHALITSGSKKLPPPRQDEDGSQKKEGDFSFDRLVAQLNSDARVAATVKQKTPAEMAIDERNRLKELERKRQRLLKRKAAARFSSVDDVEDDFDSEGEEIGRERSIKRRGGSDFVVQYDSKGNLVNADKVEKPIVPKKGPTIHVSSTNLDESDSDQSEGESESDDEGGSQSEGAEESDNQSDKNEEEKGVGNSVDEFGEGEDFSKRKPLSKQNVGADDDETNCEFLESGEENNLEKSFEVVQVSADDIPYAFDFPAKYEDFAGILANRTSGEIKIICDRLIACFHPAAAEGNKKKLVKLFFHFLRHFDTVALNREKNSAQNCRNVLNTLAQAMHHLMTFNPAKCSQYCMLLLNRHLETTNSLRKWPKKNFTVFLGVLPSFFDPQTTNDVLETAFREGVKILSQTPVRTLKDLLSSCFWLESLMNYVGLIEKWYVPELVAFLLSFFQLFSPDSSSNLPASCNFRSLSSGVKLQMLQLKFDSAADVPDLSIFDNFEDTQEPYRNILTLACRLLCALDSLTQLWVDLPLRKKIFVPFSRIFTSFEQNRFAGLISQHKTNLCSKIDAMTDMLPSSNEVGASRPKVPCIKLLTPKYDPDFNPDSKKRGPKASAMSKKAQLQKVQRKIARETRGMARELRKDSRVMAVEKMRIEKERDEERERKTRKIMASLMGQESEYQKMKKMKK